MSRQPDIWERLKNKDTKVLICLFLLFDLIVFLTIAFIFISKIE